MSEAGHDAAGRLAPHVMPVKALVAVWVTLLALTVITVAATRIDLGEFNLYLAMAIATAKAGLVALYFMHMRYDRPVNALVFLSALLFLALFIVLASLDTHAYQGELIPGYAPAVHK